MVSNTYAMPNKRGKERVMLALWISEKQLKMLNLISKTKRISRSEFVRNMLFGDN